MSNHTARNAQIVSMRQSGTGQRQIARELGISPNIVAGVIHRAKVPGKARARSGPDNSQRNERIVQARRDGSGPRQIARDLGLSASAVCGVLRRAGLTDSRSIKAEVSARRGRGRSERMRIVDETRELKIEDAAKLAGVSAATIDRYRREFGVQPVPRSSLRRNHLEEMWNLRNQGWTLEAIGRQFGTDKSTVCRALRGSR